MLQECLEVFEKLIKEKGDRVIIDAYVPKDGTYQLVEITDSGFQIINTLEIFYDKKKDFIEGSTEDDYRFISMLDYYSKLVDMNKPMDSSKTIHSNNFLSFAVKKESIQSQKLTREIIENYYQILKYPGTKYEKKKKSKILYDNLEEELGSPDIDLIESIQQYMLGENIWDGVNLEKKGYMKIFFLFPDRDKTKEYYIRESRRYFIPNIYNNNDFNLIEDGKIFGLSNNNMGMNAKKPYLENKTRKISMPNLISQEQALLQNQMFDYFMSQVSKGKNNFYINNDEDEPEIKAYTNTDEPEFLQSGYYLRMKKEKNEVSIQQADVIVDYNPNLKRTFVLADDIILSEKISEKVREKYGNYNRLWEIKALIDNAFFEGKLRYGFDTEAKDLSFSNDTVKQCFLICREQLMGWFWMGIDTYIYEILDNVTLRLIKNSIIENKIFDAQNQFNVRWSLLSYLNENRRVGKNMSQIRSALREHINMAGNEEWDFSSDDEFAYAVGQTVSYLLSLSKAKEKDESCINTFLDARNTKTIKEKLLQLYKKYNYGIIHNNEGRFGKMAAAIMEYEPDAINNEMIMAGFVSSSLIYEKKKN